MFTSECVVCRLVKPPFLSMEPAVDVRGVCVGEIDRYVNHGIWPKGRLTSESESFRSRPVEV